MRSKKLLMVLVLGLFVSPGLLGVSAANDYFKFFKFFKKRPSRAISQVYTMSNSEAGNEVLVFNRGNNGNLKPAGTFATNGLGTGGSLGNQGGMVLDPSRRWLFVVNAGNSTISSFRVLEEGVELVDHVPSGGFLPVSLTVFGTLVYVVNEGDPLDPDNSPDNITGFRFNLDGTLTPIPDSTQPLSDALTDPAQIGFNVEGTVLLITEKATNMLTTYTVNENGTPGTFNTRPSAVPTPFGFSFGDRDTVFITEANQGGAGVAASYRVNRETGVVSGPAVSLLDAENATCWVVISNDGTVGYATNTGSASVSTFNINFDGTMEPFSRRFNVRTGEGPLDLVLTRDGENLYTLNSGDNEIRTFSVRNDQSLNRRRTVSVPAGANGLAVR